MKKKFISICITLILFFTSIVPVFANNGFEYVPFWLHDFYTQSVNYGNEGSNYFATWTATDANGYESNLLAYGLMQDKNSAATFYYTVMPGDTVYFRLAVQKNALGGSGYVSTDLYVNGTLNSTTNYSVTNDGLNGSQAFIFINQDYTNNSSSKQTIRYMISNTNSANDIIYFPIACGTTDMINGDDISFDVSSLPSLDTTGFNEKLDDIIGLLQQTVNDINFEIPFELWQVYNFFINSYNYSYSTSPDRIPWLVRNQVFDKVYNDSQGFRTFESDYVYFTFMAPFKDSAKPSLLGRDGTVINAYTLKTSPRANGFGLLYTYGFNVARNTYYSLYLPDVELFSKFIPIYLGNGTDIPDSLAPYIGIQSTTQSLINIISSKLTLLTEVFTNTQTTITDKANAANNNLSNSITEFDNIEKDQVNNFTENIANLPTFDFGSISDFSTTANFVSTQMQNIYDSSDYIKFIYTAVLTFGIALVLIGRGLRR